jgi:hypothetical protein
MRFLQLLHNIGEQRLKAKRETVSCGYDVMDFQGKVEEITKNL